MWRDLFNINESNTVLKKLKDIEVLFSKLLDNETLDLKGDPFKGVQIMGLLETRILDFDHVIVTHVNEGILPYGKTLFSWIPFDVRKKFGLNTFIEQDHLYIRKILESQGYYKAKIKPVLKKKTAIIKFSVDAGEQYKFGKIQLFNFLNILLNPFFLKL